MARNTYMYILYYLLYVGIGFWSQLNQQGVNPENSAKGGWDTCPPASYIETFYCSENSTKINKYKIISRKKGPLWPTPKSALTVA